MLNGRISKLVDDWTGAGWPWLNSEKGQHFLVFHTDAKVHSLQNDAGQTPVTPVLPVIVLFPAFRGLRDQLGSVE